MLLISISSILLISFAIALYNFFTAPGFTAVNKSAEDSLVSILIPARNEEDNIPQCLEALLKQDYSRLEILAGNDNSSDRTEEIIDRYSKNNFSIKKINIPELPEGWLGKNFAADTLYKYATGDLLLFMDADVILDKNAVSAAVVNIQRSGSGLLSVFPSQAMLTMGEKLVVPLLNFFLLSLLPLRMVYKSKKVSLSAGIGQFMLFRRSAYEETGGHSKYRDKAAEDLELTRDIKRKGLKALTLIDNGLIQCRMYRNLPEAVNGFTKNFFRGSALSPIAFAFFISGYFSIFFIPFLFVFFDHLYLIPITLILFIRLFITFKSRQRLITALLHPFQIIILYIIGIRSMYYKNRIKWKGRLV